MIVARKACKGITMGKERLEAALNRRYEGNTSGITTFTSRELKICAATKC